MTTDPPVIHHVTREEYETTFGRRTPVSSTIRSTCCGSLVARRAIFTSVPGSVTCPEYRSLPDGSADYTPPEELRPPNPEHDRTAIDLLTEWLKMPRGGFVIPPHGDEQAYEFRLYDLSPHPEVEMDPGLRLEDVRRMVTAAAALAPAHTPDRYTLKEATRILNRQECDTHGHDIETRTIRDSYQRVVPHIISCTRCGARFTEDPQ